MKAMGMDKKVVKKQLRFVLLRALGQAYVSGEYDSVRLAQVLSAAD